MFNKCQAILSVTMTDFKADVLEFGWDCPIFGWTVMFFSFETKSYRSDRKTVESHVYLYKHSAYASFIVSS